MLGAVPATFPALYGGDRIMAGARFLGRLDPGWWRDGALLPANLAGLDMADPYRCVLAWWAARHLPAPSRPGARQAPPYDRAVRALCLSSREAEALGFTGVDAGRLTPGWRHLITCRRVPMTGVLDRGKDQVPVGTADVTGSRSGPGGIAAVS